MDFFSIHSMVYFGFAQKKIHSIVYNENFLKKQNPYIKIVDFKSKMDFFCIQYIGYPDILIQNGHPYLIILFYNVVEHSLEIK